MTEGAAGWIPLVAGVIGALAYSVAEYLWFPKKAPTTEASWQITGARTSRFEAYCAACLIAGDEPEWPLPTKRSREEYTSLCLAIRDGQLDDLGTPDDETLAWQFGYLEGGNEERETILDRKSLRLYLRLLNRPIPPFLDGRFDDDAQLAQ